MLKVEQRIDGGQLKLRDEVRLLGRGSSGMHVRLGGWRPLPKTCCSRHCHLPGLQESLMKNVKEAANARAVLASYHPLWLRLGAEVVVGKAVAGAAAVPTCPRLPPGCALHYASASLAFPTLPCIPPAAPQPTTRRCRRWSWRPLCGSIS